MPTTEANSTPYQNLTELHRSQAERSGPLPALRYKKHGLYYDLSWHDYREAALALASRLVDVGIESGQRIGLLSENRVEWLITDVAILAAGAVTVSPHAPLTARQIHYQLHDADVQWLFVSTREQFDKIQRVRAELPLLRGMVIMDGAGEADVETWHGFLQRGRQSLASNRDELQRREEAVTGQDLATIMYTSGTTGNPKGVMLTHDNLLSNASACLEIAPHNPDDVVLSWLPYTHIYARTIDHYKGIFASVLTCIAESADTLLTNLAEVQPMQMASVPRFYEKVLTAVADDDPEVTGQRLRNVFGPRVDWLSSGGAPLPVPVAEAYHRAGLLVLQGYGLTESAPVISFNSKFAYKVHSVGKPIPGVEVRIADDGEILTRGPHVMRGYWKNDVATVEAIPEGWLHTGDLGQLDEDGYLLITGRKKELLVLSNGKKVVPSFLEGLLMADACIDQAVVCGEGRNYLVALIVPHWDNLRAVLEDAGDSWVEEVEQRSQSPAILKHLQRRIDTALEDVSSMEQVKKVHLLEQPFSVEADEMTVSLKLRRGIVMKRYADQIDALYRS